MTYEKDRIRELEIALAERNGKISALNAENRRLRDEARGYYKHSKREAMRTLRREVDRLTALVHRTPIYGRIYEDGE